MTMIMARTVLKGLTIDVDIKHPWAVEGNLHDFKRANDKSVGTNVVHYAQKGQLYFVYVKTQKGRVCQPS
jgi:hypothetical protein